MKLLAGVVTRLMDWWAPITHRSNNYLLMLNNADWLADVEADHDEWLPDELWAAYKMSAGATHEVEHPRIAGGGVTEFPPVARVADAEPAQVFSVGGPLKSDEQIIEELVADYRDFLRECFHRR
jgi:hypothetical protein